MSCRSRHWLVRPLHFAALSAWVMAPFYLCDAFMAETGGGLHYHSDPVDGAIFGGLAWGIWCYIAGVVTLAFAAILDLLHGLTEDRTREPPAQ